METKFLLRFFLIRDRHVSHPTPFQPAVHPFLFLPGLLACSPSLARFHSPFTRTLLSSSRRASFSVTLVLAPLPPHEHRPRTPTTRRLRSPQPLRLLYHSLTRLLFVPPWLSPPSVPSNSILFSSATDDGHGDTRCWRCGLSFLSTLGQSVVRINAFTATRIFNVFFLENIFY